MTTNAHPTIASTQDANVAVIDLPHISPDDAKASIDSLLLNPANALAAARGSLDAIENWLVARGASGRSPGSLSHAELVEFESKLGHRFPRILIVNYASVLRLLAARPFSRGPAIAPRQVRASLNPIGSVQFRQFLTVCALLPFGAAGLVLAIWLNIGIAGKLLIVAALVFPVIAANAIRERTGWWIEVVPQGLWLLRRHLFGGESHRRRLLTRDALIVVRSNRDLFTTLHGSGELLVWRFYLPTDPAEPTAPVEFEVIDFPVERSEWGASVQRSCYHSMLQGGL